MRTDPRVSPRPQLTAEQTAPITQQARESKEKAKEIATRATWQAFENPLLTGVALALDAAEDIGAIAADVGKGVGSTLGLTTDPSSSTSAALQKAKADAAAQQRMAAAQRARADETGEAAEDASPDDNDSESRLIVNKRVQARMKAAQAAASTAGGTAGSTNFSSKSDGPHATITKAVYQPSAGAPTEPDADERVDREGTFDGMPVVDLSFRDSMTVLQRGSMLEDTSQDVDGAGEQSGSASMSAPKALPSNTSHRRVREVKSGGRSKK